MIEQFQEMVGVQTYAAFLRMLKAIGPDARTHRISVVIAAMLQFALNELAGDGDEGTLAQALSALEEDPGLSAEDCEEVDTVFGLIDELCTEAGIRNLRESSRGQPYSIADNVIAEYTAWYNMPWEE